MEIRIGEYYRHKEHPAYAWAKVLEILPPKTGENTSNNYIAKCEWVVSKSDPFGLIKYFKLSDLASG